MRLSIVIISTRTSLSPLIRAIEQVSKGTNIELRYSIYYTHELDENEELINNMYKDVVDSDIVLIDIRTPTSKFLQKLEQALSQSRAQIILPLVVGSPRILKYLKIGKLTGEKVVSKIREYDFDTQTLDMKSLEKLINIVEKAGILFSLGSLKDLRNYVRALRYWMYGTERNLKNLILMLLREYFNVDVAYEEPVEDVKSYTFWIPETNEFLSKPKLYERGKPTVAILLYSGMHFEQCKPVALRLYEYLKKSPNLNVLLIVGGGSLDLIDQSRKIDRLLSSSNCKVDILINLQWFRINGGPYGGPAEPTIEFLSRNNCLLINGLIMYMREVEKWIKDNRGLSPIEVITGVALPEIDGAIEPIPLGGLSSDICKDILVIDDRVKRRVRRVLSWIKLRNADRKGIKIAIIVYNYPPGEDNIGSASYLDVFKSLEVLLSALHEKGYLTRPLSKDELVKIFLENSILNSPRWRAWSDKLPRVSVDDYLKLLDKYVPPELRNELSRIWGSPPGTVNVDEKGIVIPGIVLGNVFVGVQPSRGIHEDPRKLYHSKDLPPHHQYVAFYLWLIEHFKCDVLIHLGTHGTLEFLPGKEVGLSEKCWPDVLLQDVPHVYIYHVTNPSEMTIAKRRGYAYVITHSTPPFTTSDLYEDYQELSDLLDEYEEARMVDPERAKIIEDLIKEKCRKLNIDFKDFEELHLKLHEIARAIIPKGLHYIGRRWSIEEIVDYITIVLRYDREVPSLHRLICEELGIDYDKVLDNPHVKIHNKTGRQILRDIENKVKEIVKTILNGDYDSVLKMFRKDRREVVKNVIGFVRELYERIIKSDEVGSILRAIEGGYVEPRVAGDPIRTPEVFPTGSHGYAFDPRLIPSKSAYIRGVRIAEETLRMYYSKFGRYPETVAVVLWGFETMGTRGETIGQILQYLGVRLVRRHGPWDWQLEVIPIEELGRPRIDVVVTICGIFRDTFPNLITMIDRAVRLVASLDEPPEVNYVKKHVLELGGGDFSLFRIFGPKLGAYNTRLVEMIETSHWSSREELADTYIEDMSYAYGENTHGVCAKDLFTNLLRKVDLVTQIRYAHEYDIVDLDHYYEFLGGLKAAVEKEKGTSVIALWIDTTLEREKVRSLGEAIDLAVRTRILNPKWIRAMLEHGYDGAREIAKRVEYVLGLAACTGEVPSWVFDSIYATYIERDEFREKIRQSNPAALYEIAKRLYEAYMRGYWKPRPEQLQRLRRLAEDLERTLEE